jgi:hypothetical protein
VRCGFSVNNFVISTLVSDSGNTKRFYQQDNKKVIAWELKDEGSNQIIRFLRNFATVIGNGIPVSIKNKNKSASPDFISILHEIFRFRIK